MVPVQDCMLLVIIVAAEYLCTLTSKCCTGAFTPVDTGTPHDLAYAYVKLFLAFLLLHMIVHPKLFKGVLGKKFQHGPFSTWSSHALKRQPALGELVSNTLQYF